MRGPMSYQNEIDCETLAVYSPDVFDRMTPGEFCDRFGVPSESQWDAIGELLDFDKCGKLRSIVPQRVADGLRATACGI